ncbi:hypothetical protein ACHAXS_007259 [Conticribra weissflogii]
MCVERKKIGVWTCGYNIISYTAPTAKTNQDLWLCSRVTFTAMRLPFFGKKILFNFTKIIRRQKTIVPPTNNR